MVTGGEIKPGVYRVTRDVHNAKPDRRKRDWINEPSNQWSAKGRPDLVGIPAGTIVVVTLGGDYEQEPPRWVVYSVRPYTQRSYDVAEAVWHRRNNERTEGAFAWSVLDACEPVSPDDAGALEAWIQFYTTDHIDAGDILSRLIAEGRIAMGDVHRAAVNERRARDEEDAKGDDQ